MELRRKIIGIYKITNLVNNKKYIGSSIDCYRRLEYEHKKGKYSSELLQRAISKYGINNFVFEVIECVLSESLNLENKKYLIERENYWICFYQSLSRATGYNLDYALPNIRTEEIKLKISRTQRNQKKSHNKSGIVGVRWDENRNKYIVSQSRKDINYFLGRFNTLEEAQKIYTEFCQYDYDEFIVKREQLLQRKPKTSKYIGISKIKKSAKYIAQIRVNKKNVVVGRYTSETEAAIAYNEYLLFNNLEGYLNSIHIDECPKFTEFNPPKY